MDAGRDATTFAGPVGIAVGVRVSVCVGLVVRVMVMVEVNVMLGDRVSVTVGVIAREGNGIAVIVEDMVCVVAGEGVVFGVQEHNNDMTKTISKDSCFIVISFLKALQIL
jgi:hypothetical protein